MAHLPVTEPAPAKLNLDLYVEGRRADGYHLLDSVVAFTAFGDEVTLAPAETFALTVDGPFAAALERAGESLVTRAVHALADASNRPPAFAVRLTKRIPLAAGLGGGSADAAAALRALARLWGGETPTSTLVEIARALGADVPACLARRPARLAGIGDVLAPAPTVPPLELVLVNPNQPAPTGAVYRALDPAGFAPAPARQDDGAELPRWLRQGRNDLEPAALEVAPAIGAVRARLAASGADVVRLSGSGATVFAVFAQPEAADAAAVALRGERPDWWVQRTRTP
ncbi:MAG: 4-(cytidine 5'-diphospho)-2-C-methyl-D-erythritol kinase [Alphaproteobacteria bacterium]